MRRRSGVRLLEGVGLALSVLLSTSPALAKDEGPSQRLLDAAARGDGARLTLLLGTGADPDGRDEEGRPALLLAVTSGQRRAVEALLRGGADPDAATRSGWTPLHEAAMTGVLENARVLLDAGAAPDPRDRVRGTPLDVAEGAGHAHLARLLREQGALGSGGAGFCGEGGARATTRHQLRLTEMVGCTSGCDARGSCSAGSPVGPGGLGEDDTLWVPTSCLTHTGRR